MCEPKYPCDAPDTTGEHCCPFNATGGLDCYNNCGLGADEDAPDNEDFIEDGYVDESMNPYDGTYDYENDAMMLGSEDW